MTSPSRTTSAHSSRTSRYSRWTPSRRPPTAPRPTSSTESSRARTTTGIRIAALQLPHNIPGTDDLDRPILIPGSTLSEFGASHCTTLEEKNPPNMYCWYQDPPTRYTLALAGQVDPCPVEADETSPDESDQGAEVPICDYRKDWYIGGLAVATGKGLTLLHGLASLLKTGA